MTDFFEVFITYVLPHTPTKKNLTKIPTEACLLNFTYIRHQINCLPHRCSQLIAPLEYVGVISKVRTLDLQQLGSGRKN